MNLSIRRDSARIALVVDIPQFSIVPCPLYHFIPSLFRFDVFVFDAISFQVRVVFGILANDTPA